MSVGKICHIFRIDEASWMGKETSSAMEQKSSFVFLTIFWIYSDQDDWESSPTYNINYQSQIMSFKIFPYIVKCCPSLESPLILILKCFGTTLIQLLNRPFRHKCETKLVLNLTRWGLKVSTHHSGCAQNLQFIWINLNS